MTPAYQSELATVYHADARDVLPELGTESVDLVIVDPPYGVEWRSDRRAEAFDLIVGDTPADRDGIRSILAECVRVVGQRRHLYVFGPNDVLAGLRINEPAELVWDKAALGLGDLAAPWGPAHEPISFAVSVHNHAGETGSPTLPARLRKGSVLRFPRPTGRNVRHPSEKPVDLLAELIESSSRIGELVLDPCAGSGSLGVAAILRGRRAILVDVDEKAVAMTIDRVRSAEALAAQARRL